MDSERDRATQEEEEEGLFKANAVNEEDPEREEEEEGEEEGEGEEGLLTIYNE